MKNDPVMPQAGASEGSLLPWCRASWALSLNRPIGDDEHFLDAGGQSLLALKIVSHVAETFNLTIGVRDLLAAPTPRRFCGLIEARYLEEYVSEGVVVLPDGRALACQDPLKTVAEYLASTAEAS